MKKLILTCFIVFNLQASNCYCAKTTPSPAATVRYMMDKFHCEPPKEEELLQRITYNLIKTLDPGAMYFTRPDLDTIYHNTELLKTELKGKDSRFTTKLVQMYRQRLITADSSMAFIMRTPLDYKLKEYTSANDTVPVATAIDLRTRLKHELKFYCLRQLANIVLNDSTATPASAFKQEPDIKLKAAKAIQRKIRRPLTYPAGIEVYVSEMLCDAICKAYDPHSDYFTKTARDRFEGAVTGEGFYFGFSIDMNDRAEVYITHLMPGSPAWRSGQLNKGDVIISMRWAGQNPIDMQGVDAEELSKILDDQNHKDLELTVRKADGTEKHVWLERQKVENEDEFVKSYVLDSAGTKLGYIILPGFYTESESKNGKSCANDVAREIVKLQKENIKGLILDLRNNGGGSMAEAMELAGIFIDEGILAFAKYNTEKPMGFRDPNRGTIYDGPLVVMVNKASASASEMVAGALQDYNRALIVGSPTFGKATMQVVLPADTSLSLEKFSEAAYRNATEYTKITIGRFYRVTGSTHQLEGVQPDIHLPDLTEAAGYGETQLRYPLSPDQVKKAVYFKPLAPLPVTELSAKSNTRVINSQAFKVVGRYADFVKKTLKTADQSWPMQYDEYMAFAEKYRTEAKQLRNEYEKILAQGAYKTQHLLADADRIKVKGYMADDLKIMLQNIDKDIYIQECFSIITDYLKLTKK